MTHCPLCFHPIESTAIVAAFLAPPGWSFWGEPGRRWKVCEGPGYVHFRVAANGRDYHRLATIAPEAATPQPAKIAPKPGRALPSPDLTARRATNGEDWL